MTDRHHARDFRRAAARGQLRMDFQPRRDLATGVVVAVEAQPWWDHATLGKVPHARLALAAAAAGLGALLTDWTLTEAAAQSLRWATRGIRVPVAVAVAPQDLAAPRSADRMARVVEATGADPSCLVLQASADDVAEDPGTRAATLSSMHRAGLPVGLDVRAGASHPAAGSALWRIPFSTVTLAWWSDPATAAARDAARMASDLGAVPTASGVDDDAAMAYAASLGFAAGQGRHLGTPASAGPLFGAPGIPAAKDAWTGPKPTGGDA